MKENSEAKPTRILQVLGISSDALLGQGGEARVYALDEQRITRISHPGTTHKQVSSRNALLSELGRSASRVPFAIPEVLETLEIEESIITIERRLPGRPLIQLLDEVNGEERDSLIRAYLGAASMIGDLGIERPWFGDLREADGLQTPTLRAYLEQRAGKSLKAAGPQFAAINPATLAAAFPEPDRPSLVHLDAFPGNMLAQDGTITAVLDFGASLIIGDRRLDPLTAAAYLAPEITPTATDRDRAVAQEWLSANELAALFPAAQAWIAAYWSFASDDISLYRWCQKILLA